MLLFILLNLAVLVSATPFFWWLSGFDSKLTGENEREDFIRRALRCGITLLLVEAGFWCLWRYWRYNDAACGLGYLATILPLAMIWGGCASHLAAHIFAWLIDPDDKREFDPKKEIRELDAVARLIRMGKKAEAIRLCQILLESGEANVPALEMTLEHLGVPQPDVKLYNPLTEAGIMRRQGKFTEAEMLLSSLLLKNPRDLDAAMMLVRLYAQDLRQPEKAAEVLRALEQQPHISVAHIDFARRSIVEWSQPKPAAIESVAPPESVDELLAHGGYGTAIERIEEQIARQPLNLDLRLKLAEIHAVHCGNISSAEKIVRQIETEKNFSAEQIASARAKLKEWRETRLQRK